MRFNTLCSLLLALVSTLLPDKNLFCHAEEVLEAEECLNPTGKFGVCVPLPQCPKLFHILKENPLKLEKVKFLQRATCNFNHDEPWVCCLSTSTNQNNNDRNDNDGQEQEVTTVEPTYPVPTQSPTEPPKVLGDTSSPFENHPNFRLLPNVKTCGNSLLTDRIIGGTTAGLGTYPWMALLAFSDPSGDVQYACGGTIVTSRYILTASHCVTKLPEGFAVSFVRLGEYDRKRNPDCQNGVCAPKVQDIPIEQVIPHERFDFTGRTENDIALLRLTREISFSAFTTPICLPCLKNIIKHRLVRNNRTYVAGWGRFKPNSEVGSEFLQHIHVPVQPKSSCNAYYSRLKVGNVDETRFCAGGEMGRDSCQGDSGGPIMETIFDEDVLEAKTWQFGIVSLGPSPCGGANPALYTNVSYFIPWILDHLTP